MNKTIKFAVGCVLAGGTVLTAQAQNASATLTEISGGGSGPYTYDFTMTDTGTTPIGSVWYAWTPGFNYLPSVPSSAMGETTGWTTSIKGATGDASIQFVAGSSAEYLQPGQSATMQFTSADSPSTLAGDDSGTPIGTSVAYDGPLFTGSGVTFVTSSVPEPSACALLGMTAVGWLGWRRKMKS